MATQLKNSDLGVVAGAPGSLRFGSNVGQFAQRYALVLLVLVLSVATTAINPSFITPNNIVNMFRQMSVNGILAIGQTFILLTACIDISVGSLLAVSGVVAASVLLVDPLNPVVVLLACLAGIVSCALLGLVSGIMVARFRVPPMIATLAMLTIARGTALLYSGGKPYMINVKGSLFSVLGKGELFDVKVGGKPLGLLPVPVLIFVLMFGLFWVVLNRTRFGRNTYAVGGNIKAAEASGVPVARVITKAFVISGALAGVAGLVLASRIAAGQPTVGTMYEMDAIAACVIGGTSTFGGVGRLSGAALGALIITLLANALTFLGVSPDWQYVVKGVVISLAVIVDLSTKRTR